MRYEDGVLILATDGALSSARERERERRRSRSDGEDTLFAVS